MRTEPAALEWLRANAKPFAVDVPTPDELKPLMERLQGARVVGFGEATHGDQQSQLFKTHAIREMVRLGRIDAIMLEINRTPGASFDAYVNEGKGDLATLVMDSGLFSIWKTDEFAALMLWLRGYVERTGNPIRVYGIDCQETGNDLEFARKWLERHNRRLTRELAQTLKPLTDAEKEPTKYWDWVKTQTLEDYTTYLGTARRLLSAVEALPTKPGYEEAVHAARVGIQGLEINEFEFGASETRQPKDPAEYFTRRDFFMAQNLIARLGSGRAALWAHDVHTVGALPDLPEAAGYRTVGTEVRKTLGNEYVAVGFAWTTGAFRARSFAGMTSTSEGVRRPFEVFTLPNDRPGDLGEFLAKVGPERWYVDLRTANENVQAWGKLPYYRGWAGSGVDATTWQTNPAMDSIPMLPTHDVLVYTRRIGPSTVWQMPKKLQR